ncbi:hypothetical protein [Nostocoides veronense]|uniref:Uncharacterized protein n=1 Tax=Nostocoides veronense TaxID=330836 RepID=A0ABN2LVK4_9MICO
MSYAVRSRPVARARSALLVILAAVLAVALTAPTSASASGLAGAAASTGELTGRVLNLPEELEDPSWTVCTWDPAHSSTGACHWTRPPPPPAWLPSIIAERYPRLADELDRDWSDTELELRRAVDAMLRGIDPNQLPHSRID